MFFLDLQLLRKCYRIHLCKSKYRIIQMMASHVRFIPWPCRQKSSAYACGGHACGSHLCRVNPPRLLYVRLTASISDGPRLMYTIDVHDSFTADVFAIPWGFGRVCGVFRLKDLQSLKGQIWTLWRVCPTQMTAIGMNHRRR